jgi:hypothetical protein
MAGFIPSVVSQLKEKFPHLVVLTPDSPDYEENMHRWNVAAEKKAVCLSFMVLESRNLRYLGRSDLSSLR